MSASISRDEVLRRFENLLDRTLASEEPPRGIDDEILSAVTAVDAESSETDRRFDSYALWSAMTALAQEVKLEGRAFKELNDTLGSQAARIGDELRALYRERERELQRDAERRCRREILGALIDLRDRLGRGLESAQTSRGAKAAPSGWYARLGRSLGLLKQTEDPLAGTIAALLKGYELGIERLDQTLADFNARVIVCEGRPFDPHRMNAIDKQESTEVPEGTVLEVYRNGYEWNGEVFRPAQVKVACAPAANKNE
jgi:molecular chaperone GrpE (heat shock protein)